MEPLYLFGAFLFMVLIGVPLAFSILFTVFSFIILFGKFYPLEAVTLAFVGAVEQFHLVAIPLFILAGELITRGGAGKRLIKFATSLFGFIAGGLGIVTVSTSMVFAGMSGSAVADSAAVGSVMIPEMKDRGYGGPFSAGLVAVSGTIGMIIPPSIPMIVYGFVANVSIGDMFIAGIVPGIVFGLGLMVWSTYVARKNGWDPKSQRSSPREMLRALVGALPPLFIPLIILGGIFGGVFTPTEAAAVAVVYSLALALIYRDVRVRDLPEILIQAFVTSASVVLVIAAATALSWVITVEGYPVKLASLVQNFTDSPFVFLILASIVLLVLGMFIDTVSALIVTVPLLLPVAIALGIDPVHFGLVVTVNLAIGLYTPPVGFNLFLATKIAGERLGAVTREIVPMLIYSIALLLLLALVPDISMYLVHLYRGY